jgi:hypothetical protein|tara:strand:+ start:2311 stop:2616 length:306 start_codon:yes stop_codon:yes gene_type:complete
VAQIVIQAWGITSTIEYPDSMVGDGPDAFAQQYGWEDTILDDDENEIPNPLSIEEFAIQKVVDYVTDIMKSAEIDNAKREAATAAEVEVQTKLDQIQVTHA